MITSLGEEGAGLCASRAFVGLFCMLSFCPFSLPLCVRGWLRLLLVTLSGTFLHVTPVVENPKMDPNSLSVHSFNGVIISSAGSHFTIIVCIPFPLDTFLYLFEGQVLTGIRIPFYNNCLLYVSLDLSYCGLLLFLL